MAAATSSNTSSSRRRSSDPISWYLSTIGRVPLLTPAEEIELGNQVQAMMRLAEEDKGEGYTTHEKKIMRVGKRSKERMMKANLRLVVSVAKKYQGKGLELLDLIQEGSLGLERAVEKFDPTRGYKFSTYAYWWIRQGITRAIAEKSRTIRLPIHITETLNKLKKGQRELSQELGRTPTVGELAEFLELPEPEVKDLLSRARQPVSLEMKVGDSDDTELCELLQNDAPMPHELVDGHCLKGDMRSLLEQLPPLQGRVLKMRYGIDVEEPMSLTGIGRELGMSRDRVRNLERDGLAGLRRLSEAVEAYVVA